MNDDDGHAPISLPFDTKIISVGNLGNLSGSSDGPDPSSSDLSADTVIYMGPSDDATDGEHPPVYIPSINSGDNRCAINKALKGSTVDKTSKLPTKKSQKRKFSQFCIISISKFTLRKTKKKMKISFAHSSKSCTKSTN